MHVRHPPSLGWWLLHRKVFLMKNRSVLLIVFIVFIDLLGFGLIIPIIPLYAKHGFHASDMTVGLVISIFSFMQLLTTPLWGRLSDKVGRKPVLLAGLLFSVVGYVMFSVAATLPMLFLARALSGLGGGNISAAQAYIADVTAVEDRAKGMGLLGAAFGLGFAFGPFIGGIVSSYGLHYPGFVAAGLSALAFVSTLILVPESNNPAHRAEHRSTFTLKEAGKTLKRPHILFLMMLTLLAIFAYANIYASFPLLAFEQYGYSEREVGYLFAFIGIVGAVTQGGLIRPLLNRMSEKSVFILGAIGMMIGLTLIPFHVSALVLHLVLAVLSIGTGLVNPTVMSLVSKHAERHEQGVALGMGQSFSALGRVMGPIWAGIATQSFGYMSPFFTGGVVMLLVIILISTSSIK